MEYELLIKGCINRDDKWQNRLYELFAPQMHTVALRYAKNEMDAEDILHDAFMKIYCNMHTLKSPNALPVWIKRIVVNTALKHYRKKEPLYIETGPEEILSTEETTELPDINYDFKDLLKHIQKLAPRYKVVFNLYAIEGYSHKEIATELKISQGTSKSQYARARAILKRNILEDNNIFNERKTK